ncbi:MAG: thermonuclease family protein [Acidimicrobiia bacterium]|nr:thermonuclease family protein [Acidimicrobiia bacterium]
MGRRGLSLCVAAVLAVVLFAACSTASGGTTGNAEAPSSNGAATVERVVDGDTIIVHVDRRRERVRLIGMDTPESVKPNTPVQCFALEASHRTKSLLPARTSVRLVGDVDQRDQYKRLLAYVYRANDNLFVNLALVRDGYAVPYTFPPNVAHTTEFVSAAAQARDAGRGLWSACAPDQRPSHPDVATVKGDVGARRAAGLPP